MMSDDEKKVDETEVQDGAEEAQGETDAPEAADPVSVLESENTKLKDRLLRAVAEMENLRKRADRDVKDARQYAIANFARDMLTATDNLSRALMTMPQAARDEAEGTFKSLIEGVEMTEREMIRLLEKNGITKIDPKGEKFDPHFHQAMFEVPNPDAVEGTVTEVMQAGYVIGERVLRPAMVGVAKGGPKAAPTAADQGDNIDKSV